MGGVGESDGGWRGWTRENLEMEYFCDIWTSFDNLVYRREAFRNLKLLPRVALIRLKPQNSQKRLRSRLPRT